MRHSKISAAFLATLMLSILSPASVYADCIGGEPTQAKIKVQTCEAIDPLTDPRIKQPENMEQVSDEFLQQYYKGAWITDENGHSYMYPTQSADSCASFTPGSEVEKIVSYVCCDTGAWGKCILGGVFMYDVDGTPVNTFQ